MRTDGTGTMRRAARAHGLLVALLLLVTSASLWHEYALAAHQDNETCDICLTAHGATALAAAPLAVAVQVPCAAPAIRVTVEISAAPSAQYQARAPPL